MSEGQAVRFRGTARFEVVRRLGQGGMGDVYEVWDQERSCRLALKTLRFDSAADIRRLKQEFRTIQDLRHPNLVSLGELFEDGGHWFFTMELVEGTDFLTWVRGGVPLANEGSAGAGTGHGQRGEATGDTMDSSSSGATAPAPAAANDPVVRHGRRGRPAPPVDVARLRHGLDQLGRGLSALHAAGKVHLDVKPNNILVDAAGRVVVVDFGILRDLDAAAVDGEKRVVGTPMYIAPEVVAGGPATPAADWYAVGVMLYVALTGNTPFAGTSRAVMALKREVDPPPPGTLVADVPPELESLCVALMSRDPAARPSGTAVTEAVQVRGSTPFIGRGAELDALARAAEDARTAAVTVLLQGASGLGKSMLARQFTRQLAEEDDRALVLQGRCYQQEHVPYKAVDGLVDALAAALEQWPAGEVESLVPPGLASLVRVFPVLGGLAPFQSKDGNDVIDPQELRRHVFRALRTLLAAVASRRRLILVIDDLQWADADSVALLDFLLRPPDPPRLLLIGTIREDGGAVVGRLPGDVRVVALTPLATSDGLDLARRLLVEAGRDPELAAQVVASAGGHPLFIDEVVRHVGGAVGVPGARLDDALWARIQTLDEPVRLVLELLAVAGVPMSRDVLGLAAEMSADALDRALAGLRVGRLVRSLAGTQTAIETYHDRIRETVSERLTPEERIHHHATIARGLEGAGVDDPEALTRHYREAGNAPRAALHARRAAFAAKGALAFGRAAHFYRLLLELNVGDDRAELLVSLGDALANASRGAEAATAYLEAASLMSGGPALALQGRAAQQWIMTGHLEAGLDTLRTVLEREGIPYPSSPRSALWMVVRSRAMLAMRGLKFTPRSAAEVPEDALRRIDILQNVGMAFATVDNVVGSAFQTQGLLASLRAGERVRLVRGLCTEASYVVTRGGKAEPQVRRMLDLAAQLCGELADPMCDGALLTARATAEMQLGRFPQALDLADRAERWLREKCAGVPWEIATSRLWTMRALYHMGQLSELSRRAEALRQECADRGDHYGATSLGVVTMPFVHLYADRPDAARSVVDAALAAWSARRGFHIQHYYALTSQAAVDLYEGNGPGALARLEGRATDLKRSLLLRVQFIRATVNDAFARAHLAAHDASPDERHLRAAAQRAAQLRAENMPWITPLGDAALAGVATRRGDRAAAIDAFARAAAGFDAVSMAMHAGVCRLRHAELTGTAAGAPTIPRLAHIFAPRAEIRTG